MSRAHLISLAFAAATPAVALAAPSALAEKVTVIPVAGLELRAPAARHAPEGIEVHGSVCRAAPRFVSGPVAVRLERLNAARTVVDSMTVKVHSALGPRNRACGFYDLKTGWTVGPDETLRVIGQISGAARDRKHVSAD